MAKLRKYQQDYLRDIKLGKITVSELPLGCGKTLIMEKAMIDIDKELGIRLKTLRKQAKLSQVQLAQALCITFQQIQKYEKGVNRITCSRLFMICKVLGCSPQDFFTPIYELIF